ncbi:MAG: hypothetical protein KC729_06440 [Candidatus Eisenbacteria bacterium]|uniref:Uncharacterized protein n=1 Tax=Eiseniibacteriota bacterium TaxID=2212470 RepID=A0A956RQ24_UNCEI|nr:hypothetical protein [Candidatus Eisenbacteria bacterium]
MSLYSDPAFDAVTPGSFSDYPCSPEPADEDQIGILLAAPDTVSYMPGTPFANDTAFARVLVCGYYYLPMNTLNLDGDLVEKIVFVAVDAESNRSFTGTMAEESPEEPMPDPEPSDEEPPGPDELVSLPTPADEPIGGWFNPNLADILGLPEGAATYTVYAFLGPYRSNTVTIRVQPRGR